MLSKCRLFEKMIAKIDKCVFKLNMCSKRRVVGHLPQIVWTWLFSISKEMERSRFV
jgi:hypothetical protein